MVIAVAAGMLLYPFDSSDLYRTDVGQQTTIALPDRSSVQLNTDTELPVVYTDAARNVEMHRSEAYFDVAHDAGGPFVVSDRTELSRNIEQQARGRCHARMTTG